MVTHETKDLYWLGVRCALNPTSVVLLMLFVFICSIIGVVAPSYIVDWNERSWIPSSTSLPSFI
jgi:hypothetical protein